MRTAVTLILAAGLAAGSASRGAAASRPADVGAVAEATNEFGFRLLESLCRAEPDRNVFISSASVGMALGMTLNGAAGRTREAMAMTLGLTGVSLADVNQGHKALKAMLSSPDPKVRLDIANSIWAHKGVSFVPAFLAANREFFGAELRVLDFALPASVNTINGWVAKSTNNRITSIINQL
ncbi:MAG: serpin family protein, partial [candidate division WOR-3 bacterium]